MRGLHSCTRAQAKRRARALKMCVLACMPLHVCHYMCALICASLCHMHRETLTKCSCPCMCVLTYVHMCPYIWLLLCAHAPRNADPMLVHGTESARPCAHREGGEGGGDDTRGVMGGSLNLFVQHACRQGLETRRFVWREREREICLRISN